MRTGIIVCGGNGCGKSALGIELAKKLNYTFMDIEDYYFPKTNNSYIYGASRTRGEAAKLLYNDMQKCRNFVLASVKGDFGSEIEALFRYAILISVPKEIRMQRIRNRSFQKFGSRMLPSGDLYEAEEQFFNMAADRPENYTEKWLNTTKLRVIRIDGTKPIEKNLETVCAKPKTLNSNI